MLCEENFSPNSPNQKYCINCKDEGRKIADRKRDRIRSRKKNGYKEYTRKCKVCGVEFTTYYSKKKYCGFDRCEEIRKFLNYENIKHEICDRRRYKRAHDRIKTNSIKIIEMTNFINDTGYKVLYYNTDCGVSSHNILFTLLCPNGHEWKTTFHNFKDNNNRCLYCYLQNKYTSNIELLIRNYFDINFPYIKVVYNDRNQISPKELDIFFPDHNVAIELCGLYWHSEVGGNTPRKYHYNKMISCYEKGIRLITVFEDEVYNKFDVVISRILCALNLISNRIFARKCIVREINNKVANDFVDLYHLQGKSVCKKAWGLFYDDKLVSVATIGKVTRHHTAKDNVVELKRFCSLPNNIIIGAAQKLFSRIVEYCRCNGYKGIKSYSDMRYSNIFNSVYEILGFKCFAVSKYTPHYFKNGKRFRNMSLRKTEEERVVNKTEFEIRKSQGYDRIWDCGHRTYVYDL